MEVGKFRINIDVNLTLFFIRPSLEGTYYGTVMTVHPSVRSGFSIYNLSFLPHIKLKFIL
jgi:hypothetical protein